MSRFTLSTTIAAALALCVAAGAGADRLLSPTTMPEPELDLVAQSGARAFDHIRAARQQIDTRHPVEAREELARARKLLAEAREAIPANRVQDRIALTLAHVEDPTQKISVSDVDPLLAEIETASRDGEAYDATRRYVERARYFLFYGDRDAAARELVAAAGRVPYGRLDAPLGASYERVNQAMVFLYDHDLENADLLLQAAEGNAQAVVQIAAGAESVSLPDVAAPPASAPMAPAPAPMEVIEEEVAPQAPFDAQPQPEPGAMEDTSGAMEEATEAVGAAMSETEATGEAAADAMGEAAGAMEAPAEAAGTAMGEAAETATEAAEATAETATEAAESATEAAGAAVEEATEAAEAASEEAGQAVEAATEAPEAALPDVAAPPQPQATPDPLGEAAEALGEAADEMGEAAEDAGEAADEMHEDLMEEMAP